MDANDTTVFWSLPKEYVAFRNVVHFSISMAIIIGNLLTLIAVRKTKRLRDIPTNTFIFYLALSDGSIGVLLPFMFTVPFTESMELWKISMCTVFGMYCALYAISLFLLLAIAVDRFLAVVYPLLYRNRMNKKLALIVSVLIWTIQLILLMSLTCYFGSQQIVDNFQMSDVDKLFPKAIYFTIIQGNVMIPIGGNIVLYLAIYMRLRRTNTVGAVRTGQGTDGQESHATKRAKVFTKMMAVVLGYLLLACFPYYLLTQLSDIDDIGKSNWFPYLLDVSTFLFCSNSFMNPVIYSWQSRDFREAYKKILRFKSSPSSTTDNQPGNTSTI